ncbi:MAG: helix-turn-helix domain-containing protein [Thermoplasmatales archaeon]
MIRNMRDKGMSIRSIAKEMNISRNSVRKYLKSEPVKNM